MKVAKKTITKIAESICGGDYSISWDEAPLVHKIVGVALEMYEEEAKPVFLAFKDGIVKGVYTGRLHDVCAKVASFDVHEVTPEEVPSGYAAHKLNLEAKRDRLQAELDEINNRLESGDLSK